MSWTYEQLSGKLFDPSSNLVYIGYAGGNCGKNPEGKNNPDMQDCPLIGPLPIGTYRFAAPLMQSHLGPFALQLIPDKDNEMFGRSAFYMHGDTINAPGNASEGCIIMPRFVREACWSSADHILEVVRGA